MMMKYAMPGLVFTACLFASSCFADKIGDPAAPLVVKEWIKGKPVEIKAGTNIYVVSFWNSASAASRQSIPRLNALQSNFKDRGVIVVGVSTEPADQLREFVEHGDVPIDYGVAADDGQKTVRSYVAAYGQTGLPHAFIVGKDGRVLWQGHPLRGLAQALAAITAGRYDLAAAMKADAAREEVDRYRALARAGDPRAAELGRQLLASRTNDVTQLCDLAYRIATDGQNTNRNFVLAEQALDRAEQLAGAKTAQVVLARGVTLFEQGKLDEGMALATQAVSLAKTPTEKASVENYLRVLEQRRVVKSRELIRVPEAKP